MKKLLIAGACLSTMVVATPARAQFDALSSLAGSFSDLAIQWGGFVPRLKQLRPESDQTSRWLGSYGAEFIFEIGKVNTHKKTEDQTPRKTTLGKGNARDTSTKTECDTVGRGDPKERRVIYSRAARDSVDIYTLEKQCREDDPNLQLEFGVGFFQTSRFKIDDAIGAMTGYFRETPAISIYATRLRGKNAMWSYYGALRTGVTELVSPSLEDPSGRVFLAMAPRSVEIGSVVGVFLRLPWGLPGEVFLEGAYMYRPFRGIAWSANTDDKDHPVAAPSGVRKRLDFTGKSLMIGLQITVRDPDKK